MPCMQTRSFIKPPLLYSSKLVLTYLIKVRPIYFVSSAFLIDISQPNVASWTSYPTLRHISQLPRHPNAWKARGKNFFEISTNGSRGKLGTVGHQCLCLGSVDGLERASLLWL